MRRLVPRRVILTFAVVPLIVPSTGCNKNDEMADVPQLRAAEIVPPDKQPPQLRPAKGASAGMGYDPGGPPP